MNQSMDLYILINKYMRLFRAFHLNCYRSPPKIQDPIAISVRFKLWTIISLTLLTRNIWPELLHNFERPVEHTEDIVHQIIYLRHAQCAEYLNCLNTF